MEKADLKNIKEKNIRIGKRLRGARCAVLGKFYRVFNNSEPEEAEVIVVDESLFHNYSADIERWQSQGKAIILIIDPWDDNIFLQYLQDYGIQNMSKAGYSSEEFMHMYLEDILGRKLELVDVLKSVELIHKEEIVKKVPEEIQEKREVVEAVTIQKEKPENKNELFFFPSQIPQLELPALPVNSTSHTTLEDMRLRWNREEEAQFEKRKQAILHKADIVKFTKQYDYPPIPMPFPGGVYYLFPLPSSAGEGINFYHFKNLMGREILERRAGEEKERKEKIAGEIRKRKIVEVKEARQKVDIQNTGVIVIPPFEGFEHCIGISMENVQEGKARVLLLLGHAFHANFPEHSVIVNLKGLQSNGEMEIDVNFKIVTSDEIGYYTIGKAGGVFVKAIKENNDLVLVFKGRKWRIPGFFATRKALYAYSRHRYTLDSLVKGIDTSLKELIMKKVRDETRS